MPEVQCNYCKNKFYAKPYFIKIGYGKYCSRICQYASRKNGELKACEICKKETYKSPRQLKGSKSGLFFCSRSCQTIWRNQVYKGVKHANWKTGKHVEYRNILIKNRIKKQCKSCGTKDDRVLCVHHLDGKHRNNHLSNLVWLCYNCHHLAHSHKLKIK